MNKATNLFINLSLFNKSYFNILWSILNVKQIDKNMKVLLYIFHIVYKH